MNALQNIFHTLRSKFPSSATEKQLTIGIFWSFLGTVITKGSVFGATILIARMFGKQLYGELGMIQSTIGMLGALAGFGLGLTATKYLAEFRKSAPERAAKVVGLTNFVSLATGALMGGAIILTAPWLAEHSLQASHLTGALRISALILLFNTLNGAQTGVLSGLADFKAIARVNFLSGLISFPLLIIGAYTGGLIGVVTALGLNAFVQWFITNQSLRKALRSHGIQYTFRNCHQELPILWSCSLPALIAGSFVAPARWACNAILVTKVSGYNELGIFTATLVFQGLLLAFTGTLNAPLLAMIANKQDDLSDSLKMLNVQLGWLVGVLIAIPMLGCADFIQAMFGEQYEGDSFRITLAIVLFYTTIMMFSSGVTRVLVAKGLIWWGVLSNFLWALTLIPLAFFLTDMGSIGLASSFSLAYLLTTFLLTSLYIKNGFIERKSIITKEIFLIWIFLIILVSVVIANSPLSIKILTSALSLCSTVPLIRKILQRDPKQTK